MERKGPLYLDDLEVGHRFRSGVIRVTPVAIKAFAAEFDPQPFHLDESPPPRVSSENWWPAAGRPRASPCDCWSRAS